MKQFYRSKPIIITSAVLVVIFIGLVAFWQGALYALNHMKLQTVTTSQLAAAMRQDEFWSTYRFDTLIFDGKVRSVSQNKHVTTVQFISNDTYDVSCEFNSPRVDLKVGKTYKLAAETYQAERQPQGVLLHDCQIL